MVDRRRDVRPWPAEAITSSDLAGQCPHLAELTAEHVLQVGDAPERPPSRSRPVVVFERQELPSAVQHGPLSSVRTIYELPTGQRCVVTFANRGADVLIPIRNDRGELWVGHLLPDDVEPAHFDEWEREWVPAELLRPVGELG